MYSIRNVVLPSLIPVDFQNNPHCQFLFFIFHFHSSLHVVHCRSRLLIPTGFTLQTFIGILLRNFINMSIPFEFTLDVFQVSYIFTIRKTRTPYTPPPHPTRNKTKIILHLYLYAHFDNIVTILGGLQLNCGSKVLGILVSLL